MHKRFYITGFILILAAIVCGAATGFFLFMIQDLPQIRSLETYQPPAITRIFSADNVLLAELYREKRDPVRLGKIPDDLKQAIITAEDRQFYEHGGIDLKGILRAIVQNVRAGGFVQGASTITQQLAKTLFLSPEKTLTRKIKEALLAIQLERRYTKDEILERYLNQIYLGSGGYGVESAAQKIFRHICHRTGPWCMRHDRGHAQGPVRLFATGQSGTGGPAKKYCVATDAGLRDYYRSPI